MGLLLPVGADITAFIPGPARQAAHQQPIRARDVHWQLPDALRLPLPDEAEALLDRIRDSGHCLLHPRRRRRGLSYPGFDDFKSPGAMADLAREFCTGHIYFLLLV